MAEKWDDSANDSPEVVYEGFSPPHSHTQGMINTASSSFVSADGTDHDHGSFLATGNIVEDQGEASRPDEIDRFCFVCCSAVSNTNFESIRTSMNHSHAPLLVLLTDVLGYKLEEGRLHSQVVCKACYHLLDIIDELQQTLTESKTDVRTKFLETVQKLKLKYPRTDKMLKPRCLRCIQMSQTNARKRGRGRGWKGRCDDSARGRGRGGRGRGRARSRSEEGPDGGSDNDNEGKGVCGQEKSKDALPSKSYHPRSCLNDSKTETDNGTIWNSGMSENLKPLLTSNLCARICVTCLEAQNLFHDHKKDVCCVEDRFIDRFQKFCPLLKENLYKWTEPNIMENIDEKCINMNMNKFMNCCATSCCKCSMCQEDSSDFLYQCCQLCGMCQGTFIPWGVDITLSYIGKQCAVWNVKMKTLVVDGKLLIVSEGLIHQKPSYVDEIGRSNSSPVIEEGEGREDSPLSGNGNTEDKNSAIAFEKGQYSNSEQREGHINACMEDSGNCQQICKSSKFTDRDNYTRMYESDQLTNRDSKYDPSYQISNSSCKLMSCAENGNREVVSSPDSLYTTVEGTEVHINNNTNIDDVVSKETVGSTNLLSGYCDREENYEFNSNNESPENKFYRGSLSSNTDKVHDKISNASCIMKAEESECLQDPSFREMKDRVDMQLDSNHSRFSIKDLHQNRLPRESVEVVSLEGRISNSTKALPQCLENLKTERSIKNLPQTVDTKATLADLYVAISDQPILGKRNRKPSAKAKELSLVGNIANQLSYDFSEDCLLKRKCKQRENTKIVSEEKRNTYHIKNERSNGRYICEVCGKKFSSAGGFRYHVGSHSAQKTKYFSCELCSYKTRKQADLRKHSVIHTGEKQYKCKVCSQTFSVNSSYRRHLRIHSGEKPYKCSTCGKYFRSGSTLNQHMISHTGARNYVCEVCGRRFSLRHHYAAHRKLHDGELPFKCQHCCNGFKSHGILRQHRQKNHPEEEIQRLNQLKLRRIVIKDRDHAGDYNSGDVLEQAVAATMDPVFCEANDSCTQTMPYGEEDQETVTTRGSGTVNDKGSDVWALSHYDQGTDQTGADDIDSEEFIQKSIIETELEGSQSEIRSSVNIGSEETVCMTEYEKCNLRQSITLSRDKVYSDNLTDVSEEFFVVEDEAPSTEYLDSENSTLVSNEEEEERTSQMFIVLSTGQVDDSQVYIVVDKDSQTNT